MVAEIGHNNRSDIEMTTQGDLSAQITNSHVSYSAIGLPSIDISKQIRKFVCNLPINSELSEELLEKIEGSLQGRSTLHEYIVTKVGEYLAEQLPLKHKLFWDLIRDLNGGKPFDIKSEQGWRFIGCSKILAEAPYFSGELSINEMDIYIKLGYAFNGALGCDIDPHLVEAAPIGSLIDNLCKNHLSADRLRGYTFIVKYIDNPLREDLIDHSKADYKSPPEIDSAISWCFGQIIRVLMEQQDQRIYKE